MSSRFTPESRPWSQTAALLALAFCCYVMPWPASAGEANLLLRIQGSNTIGAHLAPALAAGLLRQQGVAHPEQQISAPNEVSVSGRDAQGRLLQITVAAHGSGTGFVALAEGSAELAASSRPIKDSEQASLASLGDLRSASAEQVIALDGLAIIVHPDNPVQQLDIGQVAALFAGEIDNWQALGGPAGAVRLYARDDNSGTFDTFKELVLSSQGKQLAGAAQRFESSDELSERVSQDPQAIGFIGLPYIRQAKALHIADQGSQAMPASRELISTEDYPLSRRLFFYLKPDESNPWARALVEFAQSAEGQAIVTANGFIGQQVQAMRVAVDASQPRVYQRLAAQAQRLSVNFRFREGSAELDNKALHDLQRLLDYLKANDKQHRQLVLVGFGDPKSDPARAALLSKLRAMAVRRELARAGILPRDILGLGEQLPVASNQQDDGRLKNRRVEVWVY
ncbi:substrate-binding domain-containing protein [Pseudomonas fluvialis]|uniref:substrate-binding domain-containing protein n=1 Tax=Pseudomonas fluvialis TaxID=1793966 RepID=UPI00370CA818